MNSYRVKGTDELGVPRADRIERVRQVKKRKGFVASRDRRIVGFSVLSVFVAPGANADEWRGIIGYPLC